MIRTVLLKVWSADDDREAESALVRLTPETARRLLARIAQAGELAADDPAFQLLAYWDDSPSPVAYEALGADLAEQVNFEECVVLDGDLATAGNRINDGPRPSRLVVLAGGVLWEGGGLETASIPVATLRALGRDGITPAPGRRSLSAVPTGQAGAADDYLDETPIGRELLDGYERD